MNLLQQKVKIFTNSNSLNSDEVTIILDILSELGEVSKEILKSTNYGKNQVQITKELKLEIGDLLYSILNLLNKTEIDADILLEEVLSKYQNRLKKGSPGSENN
jgi:NTP pyrophosphatase (non-canonical NTP hydrolase)